MLGFKGNCSIITLVGEIYEINEYVSIYGSTVLVDLGGVFSILI
jgi:hypothetical protein